MERDQVEFEPAVLIDLRVLQRHSHGDCVQLALGLRERHAGFEPRNGGIVMILAVRYRAPIVERTQKEKVNLIGHVRARFQMRAKSRRHHAHDGRIEVVYLDLPADDMLIAAKLPLPEFVTDHYVPDLAYFIRQAPQEWLNAK